MTSSDGFYPLTDVNCIHCGMPLSARHDVQSGGFIMDGFYRLEYRHTESGQKQCQTVHDASPYDGWIASKRYVESRARATKDSP